MNFKCPSCEAPLAALQMLIDGRYIRQCTSGACGQRWHFVDGHKGPLTQIAGRIEEVWEQQQPLRQE